MASQFFTLPLPFLALILAHLFWGANFVVAKITLQEFPPATLAFLRFALASLLLVPFFLVESKKTHIKKEHLPQLISVGVLMITLSILLFFEGIQKTTAINASILTLIIPMFSVLMGWWFLKEKIYLVNLAGILLGLIGAVVVVGVPHLTAGTNSAEMLGNFLILLAAVVWVIGAVISQQLLKIYPSLTITAVAFMVGTVTLAVPAILEYFKDPEWFYRVSFWGILGLIYMTVLSSVSAYFLFEWGLSKVGVVKADLLQYIEPFIATVLAIIILHEDLTIPFLAGGALIAVGVFLGTLAKEPRHKKHKAHRM